jgi:hypothetical protein
MKWCNEKEYYILPDFLAGAILQRLLTFSLEHANEFVANAKAVNNPTVKPILDIIDVAQCSGTIRTINLPAALSQSINSNRGFQEGGYTSQQSIPGNEGSTNVDTQVMAIAALLQVISQLNNKLDNLYAKVVMDEFKQAEADYNKMKSDVSRL